MRTATLCALASLVLGLAATGARADDQKTLNATVVGSKDKPAAAATEAADSTGSAATGEAGEPSDTPEGGA